MANRFLSAFSLACALLHPIAVPAAALPQAPALELGVKRVDTLDKGKVYQISSSSTVAAAPAVAWRILTDYNHLADYVPDLKSARVVSRNGDKVIVEQIGAARFLFFSQQIHLLVQVHEQPPDKIDVTLVDGDMKAYQAAWELTPVEGGGTKVSYTATIEPKFYVPGLIGTGIVRSDIARMMRAVLARMERDK